MNKYLIITILIVAVGITSTLSRRHHRKHKVEKISDDELAELIDPAELDKELNKVAVDILKTVAHEAKDLPKQYRDEIRNAVKSIIESGEPIPLDVEVGVGIVGVPDDDEIEPEEH